MRLTKMAGAIGAGVALIIFIANSWRMSFNDTPIGMPAWVWACHVATAVAFWLFVWIMIAPGSHHDSWQR